MSIIEKVFHYEQNKLSVIKFKDETWFKAKQVALLLGYLDPCRSIRQNVNPEDRISLEKLIGKGGGDSPPPPPLVSNFQGSILYLNESGLYSLIFGSKLEKAKSFKRWVTKDVLPSIRKTGRYDYYINHKYNDTLTFEFKNPNGKGILSPDQSMMLLQYQNNGFKTLVSNDHDHIIEQLIEYFRDVRIKCSYCPRRFISSQSLRAILRAFIKCDRHHSTYEVNDILEE